MWVDFAAVCICILEVRDSIENKRAFEVKTKSGETRFEVPGSGGVLQGWGYLRGDTVGGTSTSGCPEISGEILDVSWGLGMGPVVRSVAKSDIVMQNDYNRIAEKNSSGHACLVSRIFLLTYAYSNRTFISHTYQLQLRTYPGARGLYIQTHWLVHAWDWW